MANQGKSSGLVNPGFKTKRDTSANHSIAGSWDALDTRAIVVHQERCAKVRNRNVACLKCAEACTSGCISLVEGELIVNPGLCVGCGTCATVCPTGALEAHNPTDAELLGECVAAAMRAKAAGGAAEVTIACQPVREALVNCVVENAFVPVVCSGRVDESLLLGLGAQGVEQVHILCGDCGYCAQKYGLDTAHLVAKTARTLLATWNAPAEITVDSKVPSSLLASDVTTEQAEEAITGHFSVNRSCAPISASDEVVASETDSNAGSTYQLLRVMKDGTLPHFIPDRRERLLDALACLPKPSVTTVLKTRLWGSVSIDSAKCSSCRLCATFCPTGSIRKFDLETGEFGIDHTPADCVNCGRVPSFMTRSN